MIGGPLGVADGVGVVVEVAVDALEVGPPGPHEISSPPAAAATKARSGVTT
jgi:hypothetical protein